MKKILALALVMVLIACVAEPEEPSQAGKTNESREKESAAKENTGKLQEKITVAQQAFQQIGEEIYVWNYDENGRLIAIKKGDYVIQFNYENGLLSEIRGNEKTTALQYKDNDLFSAENTEMPEKYTVEDNRITKAGNIGFAYMADGNLWTVKAGTTEITFYYNDDHSISAWEKGNIVTEAVYDDKKRIKHITDNNNHIIIAYGRENKLGSLSGNLYGLGENFDTMQNEIKVISTTKPMSFSGDAKEKAFNTYLSCKKFRKGTSAFEPSAFVLYRNYFHKEAYEYMLENFYCEWITW